ncbi:MAG TPA: ester cyclase [Solirubrobacteraceae bacterium]|nr:ester cyclase [Solirubrobacteraceae bacterium]
MEQQTSTARGAAEVAHRYFTGITEHDVEAGVACWEPGGVDRLIGMTELIAPDGIRQYFYDLFEAFPDFALEIVDSTAEEDRCAVRWRATATFAGPGLFQGIEPTGARIELEGCDVVHVRDGLIHRNDAYLDGTTLARQIGMMPAAGSPGEQRLTGLFNRRTKLGRIHSSDPEQIAEGVWIVRGGFPWKVMNVYLVRDGDGVLVFDAGIKAMTRGVASAGARLGGITRVVLGHGHADHRGSAPGLGAPVFCHPAEVSDAEGDGGAHYFDLSKLGLPARWLMPRLLHDWDGGPVQVSGTVEEGDEVAGFRVIHLPGHAPGQIGLVRDSDRLALVSDCFYTLDPESIRAAKTPPHPPHAAFNHDTDQAIASIRKLAALDLAAAWPGHVDPVTGDVRDQLERAAEIK